MPTSYRTFGARKRTARALTSKSIAARPRRLTLKGLGQSLKAMSVNVGEEVSARSTGRRPVREDMDTLTDCAEPSHHMSHHVDGVELSAASCTRMPPPTLDELMQLGSYSVHAEASRAQPPPGACSPRATRSSTRRSISERIRAFVGLDSMRCESYSEASRAQPSPSTRGSPSKRRSTRRSISERVRGVANRGSIPWLSRNAEGASLLEVTPPLHEHPDQAPNVPPDPELAIT